MGRVIYATRINQSGKTRAADYGETDYYVTIYTFNPILLDASR